MNDSDELREPLDDPQYERGGIWDLDEATFSLHHLEGVCPDCHLIYWRPTGAASHHGH